MSALPKLIVLLGPTASGKTSWSLQIAKDIDAEIVSADSRQIYKKMDIGTAKAGGDWRWRNFKKTYVVDDVSHYLMDFLNPGKTFNVAEFRDQAVKHIKQIHKQGKVPMLVGGTGLYISSIIDNYEIPRVPPNKKLRSSLEEKTNDELVHLLKNLDPVSAKKLDVRNKRRLIRALEVTIFTGKPFSEQQVKRDPLFDTLILGIDVPRPILYDRIDHRVDEMMQEGLEKEVRALVRQKYSWELPSMQGIGYRQFRPYLEGKASLDEVVDLLKRDSRRFARRQMTWFRRNKNIVWVKTLKDAQKHITSFLND